MVRLRKCWLCGVAVVSTAVAGVMALAVCEASEQAVDQPAEVEFFEKNIRPLLVTHCYACHSAETKPAGGLRVDDYNGLLTGGNNGPGVVPGDSAASLLLRRVLDTNDQRRMPLEGAALSDSQINDLRHWVQQGAVWPEDTHGVGVDSTYEWYDDVRREHWAWQPLKQPDVPNVLDRQWVRDDLDFFVLAGLEAAGLQPVGDAQRTALLRRITFDLTGLPPTPSETEAFLSDNSADAFARVVDGLLSSPAFGEHWGRHWLDVARYAESTGPSRNIPYPYAWRYRDYVIDAVSRDVPFNRFIQEQIAGDFLAAAAASDAERDRLATATGFLAIGVKDVNQRFKVRFEMDNVDEQIDVVSRAVLGLTVSCARCHDHKFDPIPTADYYALAGIFTSTENAAGLRNQMGGSGLAYYVPAALIPLSTTQGPPPAELVAKLEAKVAQAKVKWDAIRGTPEGLALQANGQPVQRKSRIAFENAQRELAAARDPAARGGAVHGVRDAATIADTPVRLRGEAEKPGPVVPRGFLSTVDVPGARPVNPAQSGRLELAEWLTSERNPLTARVAVNRVWHHLFGRGIVSTVDNFGTTGDTPTHPELLDHLANRLIDSGWSVKSLIRLVVLSRTYQLSAESSSAGLAVDPANGLLWRHTPPRLTAEEIRDAMLAVSGELVLSRADGSPARELPMAEIRDNGPEAEGLYAAADSSVFRSIYLPLLRGVTPSSLEAFDPVQQTLVTGRRDQTTVPGQALFLLNSGFVRQRALTFACRLLNDADLNDRDRIQLAFQYSVGRPPLEDEVNESLQFLKDFEQAVAVHDPQQAAWTGLVQALFGSAEFRYLP